MTSKITIASRHGLRVFLSSGWARGRGAPLSRAPLALSLSLSLSGERHTRLDPPRERERRDRKRERVDAACGCFFLQHWHSAVAVLLSRSRAPLAGEFFLDSADVLSFGPFPKRTGRFKAVRPVFPSFGFDIQSTHRRRVF